MSCFPLLTCCSSPFYSALSAGTALQGMREKIFWPEKVAGEVVEGGNWWLKPQLLNYCLWWELDNWQFWPEYYLGLGWLPLHWDYRRQVSWQTVLALVCNWDPGWQVSFIGPAEVASLSVQVLVSPIISACCHVLVAATGLLGPQGLWGWVLWMASPNGLAKQTKLDLLVCRAAVCSSFGKKEVECYLFITSP